MIQLLSLIALISCAQAHIMHALPQDVDNKTLFKFIYQNNSWLNKNTRSGNGSDLTETPIIRLHIPQMIERLGIKTLLDAGCGEFFWQKELELPTLESYIGIDIVSEIIEHNKQKHPAAKRTFVVLDIIEESLPQVDLILCRDLLQHFSDADVKRVLMNMKKSGSKYLLTSTFQNKRKNEDPTKQDNPLLSRVTGRGRNLRLEPFNFPEPIEIIVEGFENKTLGLWKIADLPDYHVTDKQQEARKAEHLTLLEE